MSIFTIPQRRPTTKCKAQALADGSGQRELVSGVWGSFDRGVVTQVFFFPGFKDLCFRYQSSGSRRLDHCDDAGLDHQG
jgi:hypothetical protein